MCCCCLSRQPTAESQLPLFQAYNESCMRVDSSRAFVFSSATESHPAPATSSEVAGAFSLEERMDAPTIGPYRAESLQLPIDDFVMHCELHGDPAGEPLLWLHGFGGSGADWKHVFKQAPAG